MKKLHVIEEVAKEVTARVFLEALGAVVGAVALARGGKALARRAADNHIDLVRPDDRG